MSLTPRGQQCSSMYLATPRPTVPRQRSNSLPAGLATMNAEEAGILFSAAEKATARRRKMVSTDLTPNWPLPKDSPMEVDDMSWPLPSNSTIRQSSFKSHNTNKASQGQRAVSEDTTKLQRQSRALKEININQVSSRRSISSPTFAYSNTLFHSLPVDPVSPAKRQVPNFSLKSYADGLFQFTQVRLVSSVPQVQVHLSSPQNSGFFDDEPVSSASDAHNKSRPGLESKFSDWSVTDCDVASRRQSLAVQPSPAVVPDAGLMSPDSFFGGFDDAQSAATQIRNISGYASSATCGPPLEPRNSSSSRPQELQQQQPIHHQQQLPVQPVQPIKEEISYFTNYQRFLEPERPSTATTAPLLEPPETLNIDLSPLEQFLSPATPPPPPKRSRAETAIVQPAIARACSSGRFSRSTPSTPYQLAQVAFRVSPCCVGALG